MRVAELPDDERPREKLLNGGAAALSEADLVAVLLGTGVKDDPVLDLARDWLNEVGGVPGLATLSVHAMMKRKGVGAAKGARLAAALEIGRRLARHRLSDRPVLDRPELVADYLVQGFAFDTVEVFGCLSLDARHRLVRTHVLHRGARTSSPVEPAEVFRRAIADNANSVILWHTHPSGDPSPSADDIDLTRRLAGAGRMLNVAVLDHLIVARGGWTSLRQRGDLTSI